MSNKVSGIAKLNGLLRFIVQPENPEYADDSTKTVELQYATDFSEVEVMFGFRDINIVEVDDNSDEVQAAAQFISSNPDVEGIVFLKEGHLVITDLQFFSAYTRINGVETPYVTVVDTTTYEEEDALAILENDIRLSC